MNVTREITAGILSIGDELLIGQTVNTNAGWIGGQLGLNGIRPIEVRTIGDDRDIILKTLQEIPGDIVLITGGLGPTKDDITKDVLCKFFNTRLVRNPDVEAWIVRIFNKLGRPMLEVNRSQADLPEACTVIPNKKGTAAGMWFERDGRVFVSMPGVPYEMKAMMLDDILPKAVALFKPPTIIHRTILTTGLGESHLAQRIEAWEVSLPEEGIRLAYLPSPGMVRLRLSTYAGASAGEARARVDRKAAALYALIPDLIFGEGEHRLEDIVGGLLKERGQTLSIAESCSGGYISHRITSVPGSSAYFTGGVISYANAVKMEELGIPSDMLELNGAVSQPVAEKMAAGVREALRTDWSIAVTGIAGPEGGTPDKPVGTVWLAVAGPDGVSSRMEIFPGTRDLVIHRSAIAGMNMLRKRMLKEGKMGDGA